MTSALQTLAERFGIIPEYVDQTGREIRRTSDETSVDLLRAMGVDAPDERAAARALGELEAREREELIEPVRVVPLRGRARGSSTLIVRRPVGAEGALDWSIELGDEEGNTATAEGRTRGARATNLRLSLPRPPRLGHHAVRLAMSGGGRSWTAEQSLIVVPSCCPDALEKLGGRSGFGIVTNLYTVRSARNWGVGDITDLSELVDWASHRGASFVGVNPLHALRNRGMDVSPYSPVSRLFRNPLYIDVNAVPELPDSAVACDLMASADFQAELARVRASDRVEYERVMALKRPVLLALHATYVALHRGRDSARGRDCAHYLERDADVLLDFATFHAIEDHLEHHGLRARDWRTWPAEFRHPRSSAVVRFREQHWSEVDFYRFLQFELDCQLASAAKRARSVGAAIGLYQDLAIGSSADGSDSWMFQDLFAQGASIGAPPDEYSATGQNWGLPPIDPHALRRSGYGYWIRLVRYALRHAGALRLDHVMGLFRQYWIPEGKTGREGAYVRFPSEDLLGILALESMRADAIVVGEDLGTVPEEVPPALRRWNVLSSKVLYFERDRRGGFKPASRYERCALATANTHDMPTLAGFWCGRDIELKERVGLLDGPEAAAQAKAEREAEKGALVQRLQAASVLPKTVVEPDVPTLGGAVHEFLCRTPSVLVGLSLDDLVGEVDPVNLPGVRADTYPSWTRKLSLPLESLSSDPGVATALRCRRRTST